MTAGFRLYLVTDRKLCPPDSLIERIEAALQGGAGAVQLREKDLCGRALYELAAAVLPACRRHGAPLLINDRIDIALAVGADGVHLPTDSFSVSTARRLLGPGKLIAASTHEASEVAAAHAAGADFVVFGPIYDTPSKAAYGPPVGLDALLVASRAAPIPVFAIGGLNPERIREVRAAGAWGVAVISSVLGAPDTGRAARSLAEALGTQ